jgi:hypothetical protein
VLDGEAAGLWAERMEDGEVVELGDDERRDRFAGLGFIAVGATEDRVAQGGSDLCSALRPTADADESRGRGCNGKEGEKDSGSTIEQVRRAHCQPSPSLNPHFGYSRRLLRRQCRDQLELECS